MNNSCYGFFHCFHNETNYFNCPQTFYFESGQSNCNVKLSYMTCLAYYVLHATLSTCLRKQINHSEK